MRHRSNQIALFRIALIDCFNAFSIPQSFSASCDFTLNYVRVQIVILDRALPEIRGVGVAFIQKRTHSWSIEYYKAEFSLDATTLIFSVKTGHVIKIEYQAGSTLVTSRSQVCCNSQYKAISKCKLQIGYRNKLAIGLQLMQNRLQASILII